MVIVQGEFLTLVGQNHSLRLTHNMLNLLNLDIVFVFKKHENWVHITKHTHPDCNRFQT